MRIMWGFIQVFLWLWYGYGIEILSQRQTALQSVMDYNSCFLMTSLLTSRDTAGSRSARSWAAPGFSHKRGSSGGRVVARVAIVSLYRDHIISDSCVRLCEALKMFVEYDVWFVYLCL